MTSPLYAVALAAALLMAACGTGDQAVDAPPLVTVTSSLPTTTVAGADDVATPADSAASSTTSTSSLPAPPPVQVDQVDCPPSVRSNDMACGLATVPVDRLDPAAGTTTVSLAVLNGADPTATTPLAVLQGGPGGASTELTGFYPQRHFTQVFIDQRGTGFGGADFDCPEVDAALGDILAATSEVGEELELAAYRDCAMRLREDPVLAATDNAAHAADAIDVMAALGYDRWFVYGVSYGTTIALEIMRIEPAGLEGAILDSVYPSDIDVDLAIAESAESSLAELDRTCAADPACAAIRGDVSGTLDALMDRLELEPITVALDADDTSMGSDIDVVIDDQVLAGIVFRFLYSESRLRFIPGLLDGLDRQDQPTRRWLARAVVDLSVASLGANDDGTWFAVQCADRLPFTGGPTDGSSKFAEAIVAPGLAELCQPWDRPASAPSVGDPVTSDIPALVLGGQFDPITPPEFARRIGSELGTATTVIRNGLAHGVWYGDDCVAGLVNAFIAAPRAVLDTSCADTPVPVDWRRPQ